MSNEIIYIEITLKRDRNSFAYVVHVNNFFFMPFSQPLWTVVILSSNKLLLLFMMYIVKYKCNVQLWRHPLPNQNNIRHFYVYVNVMLSAELCYLVYGWLTAYTNESSLMNKLICSISNYVIHKLYGITSIIPWFESTNI